MSNRYFGENGSSVSGLTSHELDQLANIGSVSIGSSSWGYLADLNQSVSSTSSPSFAFLSVPEANFKIGNLTPSAATWAYMNAMQSVSTTSSPTFATITASRFKVASSTDKIHLGNSINTNASYRNIIIGQDTCGLNLTDAPLYNVIIGNSACGVYNIGNSNVFIGDYVNGTAAGVGNAVAVGSQSESAANGVAIGYGSHASEAGAVAIGQGTWCYGNGIAIGKGASAAAGACVIGSSLITSTRLYGGVGIGQAPNTSYALAITGDQRNVGTVYSTRFQFINSTDKIHMGTSISANASADNVIIGHGSAPDVGSSSLYNVIVGNESVSTMGIGNDNVFLGYYSRSGGVATEKAVVVGSRSIASTGAVAIGYGVVAAANECVLGNATITKTTLRGALEFPSFASGANNAYYEGTCTLTLACAGLTFSNNTCTANYVRVGRVCTLSFSVANASYTGSSTAELQLTGAPYNGIASTQQMGNCCTIAFIKACFVKMAGDRSYFHLQPTTNTLDPALSGADFLATNSIYILGSITYIVKAY